MKPSLRGLALLLSCSIAGQPLAAQVQSIRLEGGGIQLGGMSAAGTVLPSRIGATVPSNALSFNGLGSGALGLPGALPAPSVQPTVSPKTSPTGQTALPAPGVRPAEAGVRPAEAGVRPAEAGVRPAETGGQIGEARSLARPSRGQARAVEALRAPAAFILPVVRPAGPGSAKETSPERDSKPVAAAAKQIRSMAVSVTEAGKDLPALSTEGASEAVGRQFAVLTGESAVRTQAVEASGVPAADQRSRASLKRPGGESSSEGDAKPSPVPFTRVFQDPERNSAFWRYLIGSTLYQFGAKMYGVGLPFLVSSLTRNSLNDNGDPRAASAEVLNAMVRENRSLVRISHWIAQGLSYLAAPFFGGGSGGSQKWFVRSSFIRTGILMLIPGVFLATGLMSYPAALLTLLGLVAAHAFFLGIWSAADKASVALIVGDKSVTTDERVRANSLLAFMGALVAIIAPAIGGQVSLLKELFGKSGPGGAMIYAVYGLATGVAGLIFAGIGLLGRKSAGAGPAAAGQGPMGVGSALKSVWTSLRDGLRLIFKDRALRVLCGLFLISFLFADPMYFNVLPEFAESIIKASPALEGLFGVPVLGWLMRGLTSTPMGYFGLMAATASLGSMLATVLLGPFNKLFQRLGFKTEAALTIPAVFFGLLEIPLFWLMISTPTMWSVIGLYGLQSFVTGFMTVMLAGVNQKALGAHTREEAHKIIAAQSFLLILAAVASTYVYGFVLKGIPLAAGLAIAGAVTTVLDLARAVSPWMIFTREQRSGKG